MWRNDLCLSNKWLWFAKRSSNISQDLERRNDDNFYWQLGFEDDILSPQTIPEENPEVYCRLIRMTWRRRNRDEQT